jgi:hypothetical protein
MPVEATIPSDLDPIYQKLAALESRVAALETPPPPPGPPVIPERTRWEAQMLTWGQKTWDALKAAPDTPADTGLALTYYDCDRVFQHVASYTGEAKWLDAAARARFFYKDKYVIPNAGRIPGYWNFTTGLRMQSDRATVELLSKNAAYAPDSTNPDWTKPVVRSREAAYAIVSYIDAELCGAAKRDRRQLLVDQAYGHLDQFVVAFQDLDTAAVNPQPFMVALTAHALIRDFEETGDGRLFPKLTEIADLMWEKCWVAEKESFWYDEAGKAPAPDLNLLIAPLYAWLWKNTGKPWHLEHGDKLFAGGVKYAYQGAGKHFNQNYWWSFDYVTWRS